jgi:hypothetical protein
MLNQYIHRLKSRGLVTWFDEASLEGYIRRIMASGIERSKCVIVFVSSRYRDKVNGDDGRDNCQYEFNYSFEQLEPEIMIDERCQ